MSTSPLRNPTTVRELFKYTLSPIRNTVRPRFRRVTASRILGIASTGHGASLTYLDTSGTIVSSQLERWTGTKHMMLFSQEEESALRRPRSKIDRRVHHMFTQGFGRFPDSIVFEDTIEPWRAWLLDGLDIEPASIDLVVTSDSHFATGWARLGPYLQRWFPNANVVRGIEHHEIHQRQAFWASGFRDAAVLTLDSCGEALPRRRFRKLSGTIAFMDQRGTCRVIREWLYPETSSGLLYDATTHHVGFHQGEEGKTMGLAPYGDPAFFESLEPQLELHDDGGFSFLDLRAYEQAMARHVPKRARGDELEQGHMDVAYAGQAILDRIVAHAWRAALESTGRRDLVYAGGVALNSVSNGKAWEETAPRRVYIPTNPGDPGHSLGCALFGAYEVAGWRPPREELLDYLGPAYDGGAVARAVHGSIHLLARPERLAETVAACIANGHIVGRFDGGAEFGPRALGNRSILADPRRPGMKDHLNLRVKHREWFRPFAPTVLEEYASEWFELDEPSPFMLRVVPIRPDRLDRIPAVAHVDGTARVQTLSERQNPGYRQVVAAFHRLTGLPMVLNTSFNLAGKPIVETPEDAVACFETSEVDVLVVGPYVLSKKPLTEYVEADSGA